jgi:hypothetical protein
LDNDRARARVRVQGTHALVSTFFSLVWLLCSFLINISWIFIDLALKGT